ncbi:twin-arginine translocase subunit TatC [Candidatus Woesearchaeota archaeon]|nr:twin-arginine translocase subunit TatC [Candidatus Woesearchaeota archaeon]
MELPLHEHLDELRKRFIIVIVFLFIFFIVGFLFSGFFIKKIIHDLVFIENVRIIGLTPIEYFLTQVKVGFLISFIITLPIIIYQLLVFISPGMNRREKKSIKLILPSFILLFLIGVVFTYFIFLPVAVYFLGNLSKGIIENIWSIDAFINFVLLSCLSFGLIFQLPLLLITLNRIGIIDAKSLRTYRAHTYVIIFILSAVITPPDAITQLIIALPLVMLYEASLLIIR